MTSGYSRYRFGREELFEIAQELNPATTSHREKCSNTDPCGIHHVGRRNNTIFILWERKYIVTQKMFHGSIFQHVSGVYLEKPVGGRVGRGRRGASYRIFTISSKIFKCLKVNNESTYGTKRKSAPIFLFIASLKRSPEAKFIRFNRSIHIQFLSSHSLYQFCCRADKTENNALDVAILNLQKCWDTWLFFATFSCTFISDPPPSAQCWFWTQQIDVFSFSIV